MRYWPTLVMVLVLAGLGLYLYAIDLPQKESHDRQDTADKKVLLFDQETLSGFHQDRPARTRFRLDS